MPLLYRDPYLRAELEKQFGPPKVKPFKERFTEMLPLHFSWVTVALLCALAVTGNLYLCIPLILVAVLFVVFAWTQHWFSDESGLPRVSRKALKKRNKRRNPQEPSGPHRIAVFIVFILAAQAALSILPTGTSAGRALDDGLVAHWNFDEGAGYTLRDVSGNRHNGSIYGEPMWVDGVTGTALSFDGLDDYVIIKNAPDLNFGSGDFSYSLWLRLDTAPTYWSQLLCKRDSSGEDYELQISAESRVEFVFGNQNTGYARALSNTTLKVKTWYMITVARGNGNASLYVNAKLDSVLKTQQNVTNNNDLRIGDDNYFQEYFKGVMDDIRIWNRALSPDEVAEAYNDYKLPDLSIVPDDILLSTPSPPEGALIAITAVIHNEGAVEVKESGIQFFDGNAQIDKNGVLPSIKPGEYTKYTVRWNAFPGGYHNIVVKVDYAGMIKESDELNNKAVKSVYVQPPPPPNYVPDLTVRPDDISFSVPNPMENETVMISAKVLNIGTGNATNIVVRVTDGKNLIDKDIVLSEISVNGTFQVNLAWKAAPAGLHDITVSLDPGNLIAELSEQNNVAVRWINVSAPPSTALKPDLYIGSDDITFSASPPVEGTTIDITVTVHNAGAGSATAVAVRFLDGKSMIGPDQLIPGILPGGLAQATARWTATPAALHTIIVWADPANQIDEVSKDNNRAERTVQINPNTVNVNHPPRFTSSPPSLATVGVVLSYQVTASDQDSDRLTLSLGTLPESGMSFDPQTGMFLWTPALVQAGDHRLMFSCSDGLGGIAEQSFIVRVDVLKPLCAVTAPAANQSVSGTLVIQGTAFRGATALVMVQVRIDGGRWMDASGTSGWSFPVDTRKMGNGVHRVEARSFDSITESETVLVRFSVRNVDPGVTRGEFPFCFSALTIAFVLSAMRILYIGFRRRKMPPPVR